MKARINGKTYDTEAAENIAGSDQFCGPDRLYRTPAGDFFLVERRETRIGREQYPAEQTDPREASRTFFTPERIAETPDAVWESLKRWKIVVPLSHREALIWTIKQMMPDTFKGYLLESI